MKKTIGLVLAAILLCVNTAQAQTSMSFSIAYTSLSANAGGAGTIGTAFTAPPGSDAALVTWTTSYSAPPASITMLLQASLNNSTWFTLDTSTAVGGELRNIATSAKFFRCNISAVSGAVNKTCSFVLKRTNSATQGTTFASSITAGGDVTSGDQFLAANGTALLPAYSFTSEPTLGFWRSAAGTGVWQGSLLVAGAGNNLGFNNLTKFSAPANGALNILTANTAIGSQLKVDALPTIASGFGTSPSVRAGSTPFAGSLDVGTGGVATSGVILFNGTAFPFTPFVVVTTSQGAVPTIVAATTTQVTFTTSVAWPSNTVLNWIAVSPK